MNQRLTCSPITYFYLSADSQTKYIFILTSPVFAGATPLHRAAGVSSTDCVLALLSARANVNAAHQGNRRHAMDMANTALQAVLREAGGVRANLGAGSAPSSREAFPERSRQARVPGQQVSQSRRDRTAGFRGGKGRGGGKGGGDRRDERD